MSMATATAPRGICLTPQEMRAGGNGWGQRPSLVPQQGLSLAAPVGLVLPASPMWDLGVQGWVLTPQGEDCTADPAFRLD